MNSELEKGEEEEWYKLLEDNKVKSFFSSALTEKCIWCSHKPVSFGEFLFHAESSHGYSSPMIRLMVNEMLKNEKKI